MIFFKMNDLFLKKTALPLYKNHYLYYFCVAFEEKY